MNDPSSTRRRWQIGAVFALASAALLAGASRAVAEDAQARFASPDEAVAALVKAVTTKDTEALRKLFGPALDEIANPDPIQRDRNLTAFAGHLAESATLSHKDENTAVLIVGKDAWPFPVPLVKQNGQWGFDTAAGKEEILNRRIGRDELAAIDVCLAYVKAQREYALKDRAGNGVMEYARKFKSTPGLRDGLYWDAPPGEDQSPFGPLVARAHAEGYGAKTAAGGAAPTRHPFHGYFFRILTRQGDHAPGGRYDYVINGHLVAGFALVAWPAVWGNSGVMTFLVNQQGKVYQKNLGARTAELAEKLDEYNPDETWKPAE